MPGRLLREFIRRIINEDVTSDSHGHPSKLRIFDLDDTLVHTDGVTHVRNPLRGNFDLSPSEYAVYVPQQGDEFDFRDFKTLVNPKTIKLTTQIFMNVYKKWGAQGLVILTARGPDAAPSIKSFLDELGATGVEIITVNTGDPKAKSAWIEDRIRTTHPRVVEFFDDSNKNVGAVAELQSKFDPEEVKIISRQVVRHAAGVTTRSWRPDSARH